MQNLINDFNKLINENQNMPLPIGYFYSSLAFCLTDAIFSINVKYKSVENTINYISKKLGIDISRKNSNEMSIKEFLQVLNNYGDEELAFSFFGNKQRTSTTNGITKALAVKQACKILLDHRINCFADVNKEKLDKAELDFVKIKGQKSGISYKYFCMLAGDENLIKPDRMICRFIAKSLNMQKEPSPSEAEKIFRVAFSSISDSHPKITPRFLDYMVWDFQRKVKK